MTTERRQFIRGDSPEYTTEFRGLSGEITVDLNLKTVRVHDGVTKGGNPLASKNDLGNLQPKLPEEQTTALADVVSHNTVERADQALSMASFMSYASKELTIEVSDWVSSTTYPDYPYQATIADAGIPYIISSDYANYFPIVYFPPRYTEVLDGTIAPAVNFTSQKRFRFYAKKIPAQAIKAYPKLIYIAVQGE